MENSLCLQPQYFREFLCDPFRCNNNCCARPWNIIIDADTYEKYSRLGEQKILRHIRFDEKRGEYILIGRPCPFLDEKNFCRIQLEHGENFLSLTCRTYPRKNYDFGKFFERSLTVSCPLAAELILFRREPLQFELTTLSRNDTAVNKLRVPEKFFNRMIDIQLALISIMQERTLSIGQRLIVLGFFLDKLDEISADTIDDDALTKLIAAYESKKFLAEQVPLMLASVRFDVKKFVRLVIEFAEIICGLSNLGDNRKFIDRLVDTLDTKSDKNNFVNAATVTATYKRLADARKNFLSQYSTLLENYLVNEIFLNCYPWRFADTIANNFAVLLTTYKIFELLLFAAAQSGFDAKDDLLALINWFAQQTDHNGELQRRIFNHCKNDGDIFALMENLIEQ